MLSFLEGADKILEYILVKFDSSEKLVLVTSVHPGFV